MGLVLRIILVLCAKFSLQFLWHRVRIADMSSTPEEVGRRFTFSSSCEAHPCQECSTCQLKKARDTVKSYHAQIYHLLEALRHAHADPESRKAGPAIEPEVTPEIGGGNPFVELYQQERGRRRQAEAALAYQQLRSDTLQARWTQTMFHGNIGHYVHEEPNESQPAGGEDQSMSESDSR